MLSSIVYYNNATRAHLLYKVKTFFGESYELAVNLHL